MERKNVWLKYDEAEKKAVYDFGEEYRIFLSECKTERECVTRMRAQAEEKGYEDLEKILAEGRTLKPGIKYTPAVWGK